MNAQVTSRVRWFNSSMELGSSASPQSPENPESSKHPDAAGILSRHSSVTTSAPFSPALENPGLASPAPAHVLLFGKNAPLLHTRYAVLARHFRMVSISRLDDLALLPSSTAFDVAVLCHTLKEEECKLAAQAFRKEWPEGKVVALLAGDAPCLWAYADQTVEAAEGPGALVAAVQEAALNACRERATPTFGPVLGS